MGNGTNLTVKEIKRLIAKAKKAVDDIPSIVPTGLARCDPETANIQNHGNCSAYREAIDMKREFILSHPDFVNCEKSLAERLSTPSKPISKHTHQEMRIFLQQMMTEYCHITCRTIVLYGKAETLPPWWPSDIAWTSGGIQSGTSLKEKHRIAWACYRYYGKPQDDDENVSNSVAVSSELPDQIVVY